MELWFTIINFIFLEGVFLTSVFFEKKKPVLRPPLVIYFVAACYYFTILLRIMGDGSFFVILGGVAITFLLYPTFKVLAQPHNIITDGVLLVFLWQNIFFQCNFWIPAYEKAPYAIAILVTLSIFW